MSISQDTLPPRLRAAVAAGVPVDAVAGAVLEDPLGAVELAVGSATEHGWADGVFGPAGFVLAASDDEGSLMTGTIPALALQLASLTALGPRPVAEEGEFTVGAFSGIGEALAAGDLPAAVAAVLAEPDRVRWCARACWLGPDGPDGPALREVIAIDGGGAGILLVTPIEDSEDVALVPCSATDVWRALCGLLPYPAELL